uniref:Uncharacterized protein n=1 Tax=Vespula pensylvanica TaxID=30213 RepID=A0A834KUP1_VESPE|nr:hypothetical protein H0235_013018 [Vespula pensylvanica]
MKQLPSGEIWALGITCDPSKSESCTTGLMAVYLNTFLKRYPPNYAQYGGGLWPLRKPLTSVTWSGHNVETPVAILSW